MLKDRINRFTALTQRATLMIAPYHKAVQGTTCVVFLPVRNEVQGNTKLQDQQPVKAGQ